MTQIAFIMPTAAERWKIGRIRESVVHMRMDQCAHFYHLLKSWGVFGRPNAESAVWRAIKRTLRDRP